ncbi:transposase [Chromobacterium piscinae]|uniref:transposase n=1 Tax=Chromobacterium piscinae TaxID=686831 RepID=UPI0039082270
MPRPSRDAQWARLPPILPCKWVPGTQLRRQPDLCQRRVVGAVFRGASWSDLPVRYGKYKTAHKRFTRWAAHGVWSGSLP